MNSIKPGESFKYNLKNPPPEGERPPNLYLSAFCSMHTVQTVEFSNLDKYDGTAKDQDSRPGQIKVKEDDFSAILTKDGEKVIKQYCGESYISGLTGDCHHEKVKVYMEESNDKLIEQVTYPEQHGMVLRNETNKQTGDVVFTYLK
jgi:hypothetical protein